MQSWAVHWAVHSPLCVLLQSEIVCCVYLLCVQSSEVVGFSHLLLLICSGFLL